MKRVLPWLLGNKHIAADIAASSVQKKGARKLASAVRSCFEQLELRQLLSVSANPGGAYSGNEGATINISGSATGATNYQYKWDLNYNGSAFHTQATGAAFNYKL